MFPTIDARGADLEVKWREMGREMREEGKGEGAWLSEHRAKICLANTLPVSCIQPTSVWRQKKPSYSPSAHIVFSLQSICRFVCYMPRGKENTAVHGGDGVGVVVQYRIDAILAGGTFKICVMIYQSLFFIEQCIYLFFFYIYGHVWLGRERVLTFETPLTYFSDIYLPKGGLK